MLHRWAHMKCHDVYDRLPNSAPSHQPGAMPAVKALWLKTKRSMKIVDKDVPPDRSYNLNDGVDEGLNE